MGFEVATGLSALAVFAQGVLSFFSPCVLPLVPVYLSYLSGGAAADAPAKTRRRKLMLGTFFFVLGISFAFFALGLGMSALGQFLSQQRVWIARIGGVVLIVLGLVQLGVFGKFQFSKELRLPFRLKPGQMSPLMALVMGFTFSFAWTPCVGPALASALLMAGTASSGALGFAYIGLYTLGFVLPFLALGLFADVLLGFLQRSKKALAYTVKIGAAVLVLMGVLMVSGLLNAAPAGGGTAVPSPTPTSSSQAPAPSSPSSSDGASSSAAPVAAPDFTLKDQNGEEHTLSEYKGKVVFLNFWADWCGYCVQEMPDIQQLYEDWEENSGDVVILGITNGLTQGEMAEFFEGKGLTYPTLLDTDNSVFSAYFVNSLPTTFMIDAEGNVYGYIAGMLDRATMDSIIAQTKGEE